MGRRQARPDPGRGGPRARAAVRGLVRDRREPGGAAGAGVRSHGRGPGAGGVAHRGRHPRRRARRLPAPGGGALRCARARRQPGLPLARPRPRARRTAGRRPLPTFDDGVLAWVRLDDLADGPLTDAPILGPRPANGLAAVATVIGHCEPEDVVANRLDPWHGAWLHPYSFAALTVRSRLLLATCSPAEDRFLVEVTFTVGKRLRRAGARRVQLPRPAHGHDGDRRRRGRRARWWRPTPPQCAPTPRATAHGRDRGGGGALRDRAGFDSFRRGVLRP